MSLVKWQKTACFPHLIQCGIFNQSIRLGTHVTAMNLKESDPHYYLEIAAPGLKEDFQRRCGG